MNSDGDEVTGRASKPPSRAARAQGRGCRGGRHHRRIHTTEEDDEDVGEDVAECKHRVVNRRRQPTGSDAEDESDGVNIRMQRGNRGQRRRRADTEARLNSFDEVSPIPLLHGEGITGRVSREHRRAQLELVSPPQRRTHGQIRASYLSRMGISRPLDEGQTSTDKSGKRKGGRHALSSSEEEAIVGKMDPNP